MGPSSYQKCDDGKCHPESERNEIESDIERIAMRQIGKRATRSGCSIDEREQKKKSRRDAEDFDPRLPRWTHNRPDQ